MPDRSPVPVVVLSGGLGSGKTSLLNHVLEQGVGRVGVVINDFGAINVDAFLVHGQVDATASISGGCLCCLSDPSELDDILASLSRPELDLDVILVEASGLAEPRELARMIVSTGAGGVRFGGVVEIVDAAAWADVDPATTADRDLPVAVDHLAVASLVVVNKIDRLGPGASTPAVDAVLARHAPTTPVVRTSHGAIPAELLFDAADRPAPTGQLSFTDLLTEQARLHAAGPARATDEARGTHPCDARDHDAPGSSPRDDCVTANLDEHDATENCPHAHDATGPRHDDCGHDATGHHHDDCGHDATGHRHEQDTTGRPHDDCEHDTTGHRHDDCGHAHHRYASVSVESPRPADPGALIAFLDGRAPGVYRVKGRTWVDAPGHGDMLFVQAVGGWLSFRRRAWPAGVQPRTELVAIGVGMDTDHVRASMEDCLTDSPVDPADLRLLRRYTHP